MIPQRLIPLAGAHNLRDLGGYPASGGQTAWRRALRADSLHRLDRQAMETLRDMGCTTVIDLRHGEETGAQANPFAAGFDGVLYHNISLFAGLDPSRPGLKEAEDVLFALYCQALEECAAEFVQVLRVVADAPGTVLFHCTAGKDRTGMIAALLLLLAGTPRAEIVADYALTSRYSPVMFAALRDELEAAGRDFDLASPLLLSEAATMEAFLGHLDSAHGGAEAYLLTHGLTEREIAALRSRMLPAEAMEGSA